MRTYSLLIGGMILFAFFGSGLRGGLIVAACFAPGYLVGSYSRGRALVHEAHKRLTIGRRHLSFRI